MIKAVIFDMDGLLIDSEPFWQQAEMEVFKEVGIHLTLEMCLQTTGLRIDEVTAYWYKRHPWKGVALSTVTHKIVENVIHKIQTEGEAKAGVFQTLDFFKQQNIPMAIASSSYHKLIQAVVAHLDIGSYFQHLVSAEDDTYGKPHPSVYIRTAEKLGVSPMECLVYEDSFNGVLAAKAARMKVVAVPEVKDERFIIANKILQSLEEWNETLFQQLQ